MVSIVSEAELIEKVRVVRTVFQALGKILDRLVVDFLVGLFRLIIVALTSVH